MSVAALQNVVAALGEDLVASAEPEDDVVAVGNSVEQSGENIRKVGSIDLGHGRVSPCQSSVPPRASPARTSPQQKKYGPWLGAFL